MMGTQMVSAMSVIFNQLTWLITQRDFINFSHCESFRSYITQFVTQEPMFQRNMLIPSSGFYLEDGDSRFLQILVPVYQTT
jgi:hypothetical protein